MSIKMAGEVCRLVPSQKGKMLLQTKGYLLSKNKQRGDIWYWHCIERISGQCTGFVCTTLIDGEHRLRSEKMHNHLPRMEKSDVADARALIKYRAKNTEESPTEIIQAVTAAMPTASAIHMPNREALRQVVRRIRRKSMAPRPTSLQEISVPVNLSKVNGVNVLARDDTFGSERILLFSTEDNLRKLHHAPYWIMDGPSTACPTLFRHLCTIHAMVGTNAVSQTFVPLAHGLLTSKSEECYTRFLQDLKDYAADYGIELAPQYILTDFELAAINAVKSEFGGSTHKCSSFHLEKYIWRSIQCSGLATEYGENGEFALKLRLLQALAFLPASDIPAAFEEVKKVLPERANSVVTYFEENYVLGRLRQNSCSHPTRFPPLYPPTMWSLSENSDLRIPGIQNKLEGWHRRWNNILGQENFGVQNLINSVITDQQTTMSKIERIKTQAREQALQTCIELKDIVDVLTFLQNIAYNSVLHCI
ncbi:nicotinamide/nicotinic acid mononucleotide adenylyltransferase 2 isoform X1 [Pseudophryne corroboree]|uniref:nicotinamide/nicotinic acid mononucleotide adenylyltransferase 2 isoform X1 n=1 Tax=Pseudophryne corroboree TaxID=495146 RepID=UPI003081AF7C